MGGGIIYMFYYPKQSTVIDWEQYEQSECWTTTDNTGSQHETDVYIAQDFRITVLPYLLRCLLQMISG
jgi:hypothetical protein